MNDRDGEGFIPIRGGGWLEGKFQSTKSYQEEMREEIKNFN